MIKKILFQCQALLLIKKVCLTLENSRKFFDLFVFRIQANCKQAIFLFGASYINEKHRRRRRRNQTDGSTEEGSTEDGSTSVFQI